MWRYDNRDRWTDLDALQEPPDAGRALYVGGFVLADPFDIILRNLSIEYLERAWKRTDPLLERYRLRPGDLSWGYFNGGETYVAGARPIPGLSCPSDYMGWSSRELATFDYENTYSDLDNELRSGSPKIACAATWRSHKWRIVPDDYPKALRLIEALCIDEPSEWSLGHVLQEGRDRAEPWVKIAQALQHKDQGELDRALDEAKTAYTPVGYRIVVQGYAAYAKHGVDDIRVRLPGI